MARRVVRVPIKAADSYADTTDLSGVEGLAELHGQILEAWNRQDAGAYAGCFVNDALVIGFDGSEMHGTSAIAEQLATVFADHQVATYVRLVRSVRHIREDSGLLHAVVGMIAPGDNDVMPDRHAVQLLVGVRDGDRWRAVSFQNTPAQLHGRPEAVDALTEELRAVASR